MDLRTLVLIAIALAGIALALASSNISTGPPPATHTQLCAVLGAIMGDNDTTTGLPARAARLYQEYHC